MIETPGVWSNKSTVTKKDRIGLILANIDSGWAQNIWLPFVTPTLNEGKSLFIFPGGRLNATINSENLRNAIYSLVNSENLDGFISHSSSIIFIKSQEFERFHSSFSSLPFVTLALKVPGHPCVEFDAYTGMKHLILHCINVHGARKIAFIQGPAFHPSAQTRLRAYHDALKESGLPSSPDSPLITDPFMWGNGTEAAAQLLESRKLKPGEDFDTLVGSNDQMALEAIEYFSKRGYYVPRDYHALGFDDSLEGRFAKSPLSTVGVPYVTMGKEAFRAILESLEKSPSDGDTGDAIKELFLPTELIIRESCGCQNMYHLPIEETGQELYEIPAQQDLTAAIAAYFELNTKETNAIIKPLVRAWQKAFPEAGSESRQPSAESFLYLFEKTLIKFFKANGYPEKIFRFLKYACKTGLILPSQIRKLEPALYQAIFSAREPLTVIVQHERTKLNTVLTSLKYELLGIREKNSLIQSLSKYLPKIGIDTAGIALYKDNETSIWIGSFSPDGIGLMREEYFPAKKLVPEPLNTQFSHGIFMVQPLFMENRSLGYFIHNVLNSDAITFEELRSIVSYALKGIIQYEEVESARQKMQESDEQSRLLMLQKEAAQAASEAKSQFLSNMSHEIRTPMNSVLGMTELLLSENLTKRQMDYAEDIRTSAMALLDIINDILDISKIQSGKMTLNPVHFDFRALLDNICSMIRFLIIHKEIVFSMETQGEIPKCLYADDVRLRQILLNVLGNAVKFTKAGHVSLTIEVSDADIRFIVSDTGIGIRQEEIPRVFDAFVQADDIHNRNRKGTGLGLSITKSLVEMMGGHISAESVYGEGATFRIVIPKVIGDEKMIRSIESVESVLFTPDIKILVVDDNLLNLNVVCGLLWLSNLTVFTAESGRQAIEIAGQNQYDLIFMDHMMPEMDGVEATKILREMGVKVPIIALTANAVTQAKEMMLAAGMDDFLPKPILKSSLNEMLIKWLPNSNFTRRKSEPADVGDNIPEKQRVFWDAVKKIEYLSLRIGLERVSGKYDAYREMLHLSINEIDKCDRKLHAFLAANDMRNFTIEAHSIKNSLANLGAMKLSARAYELEAAALRNDTAFCALNLNPFLDDLRNLSEEIKKAFSELYQDNAPIIVPPELELILVKMKDAMNEMDYMKINDELRNLNALEVNEALKGRIEEIETAVILMDYPCAVEAIQELLKFSGPSKT